MKFLKSLITAAVVAILASQAVAVTSGQWEIKSQDFASGEMKNLSLSSKGQVRLEREFIKIEPENKESLAIWSSAIDSKGAAYFGTGSGAAIYKLSAPTEADKGGKLEKIKLDEKFSGDIIVTKMAVDAQDNVYAALMPSGRIIKITPDGTVSEYANLSEFYIWDFCFDANGAMYVGTGPAGRLYRLTQDGKKADKIFDSDEDHVFSLAIGDDGALYFGTSQGAVLFKMSAEELAKENPAPTVVYDFPGTDIRAIYARQGEIYLAVNNAADESSYDYSKEMLSGSSSSEEEGPPSGGSEEGEGKPGVEYPVKGFSGGIVVKLDKNGDLMPLLQSSNLIASIRGDDSGIYIAAVGENKIYRYNIGDKEMSFFTIKEPQALTFEILNGNLAVIGTSGPGVIYRVGEKVPTEGVYTSRVLDAANASDWGNIQCKGAGKFSFQTRSGNTEKPDNTWTDWSEASTETAFQVKSPRGRFLQFRATWQEPQAMLEDVTIYYSVLNLRPVIANVALGEGEGSGSSREGPSPAPPAGGIMGGGMPLQVAWQAIDPNGDALEFNAYYKEVNEKRWKLLNRQGPVREPSLVMPSDLFPTGAYQVKVVASDKPGNPNGNALEAEMISDKFTIDNSAPKIAGLNAATSKEADVMRTVIGGTVTEDLTRVTAIEYALDGADWTESLPTDGVFDSATEEINIILNNLEPGEHTIVVRTSDANGNKSTAHIVFEAPQP